MKQSIGILILVAPVVMLQMQPALANGVCNGNWRGIKTSNNQRTAGVGDLMNLTHRTVLESFPSENNKYQKSQGRLSFGYVVANANTSGAILVKIRHQWNGKVKEEARSIQKVEFPSAKKIKLQRPSYDSPCGNGRIGPYDYDARIDEYVDNTYFGFPDLKNSGQYNLEKFHAELGYRGRSLLVYGRICETTHHSGVRGHFAYSGSGQVASTDDRNRRQQARVTSAVFDWSAHADPFKYENKLHTIIVAYGAKPQEPTCVSFDIPFPPEAEITEIGIVDADQALGGFAIQGNWRLNRTK